ncbi:cytochrome c [Methylococcus sp. EFPC2]|uniref:c-type cytochrome n=1 Tax=Methylococcus sp. EFPC2 TaxID=2812648 RepID=UPI0019679169|nr:cytochrome c [Methylococcus sp. EFPC2]QSA96430.1 cytochrome c [Methylococcus sp. EFPC2]
MNKKLILALGLTAMASAALAGPIEDQIRFRQSAYSFSAWNLGKIKAQVVDKPDTYNKEQVLAAAKALAAIADSGLATQLYGPGTDQGTGWQKTRLKPEYFEKKEKAEEVQQAFIKETAELAKVAEAGDVGAIKAQFAKVSGTCKSCHDAFRLKDVE